MLTLTLVIPVFNEENQIKGCLESIARQTVMPYEVIVVDNNCSDKTVAEAQKFPFVRIVSEANQGRGHARSAGFNAATSDIIGRIDADSRLDKKWVEHALSRFQSDDLLMGLTGIGSTSFIPGIRSIRTTLFSRSYYWYIHASFRTITMWGSNMALRSQAWRRVADKVCLDDSVVHEDQDISLWIAAAGDKIEQDNDLKIEADGQEFISIPKVLLYRRLFLSTKRLHQRNGNFKKIKRARFNLVQYTTGVFFVYIVGGVILVVALVVNLPKKVISPVKKNV